jgi:hypothetical protein
VSLKCVENQGERKKCVANAKHAKMFEKQDRWRRHPQFRMTHVKQYFPGFGIAAGIFSVYVIIDWLFLKPSHKAVAHGGDDSHGKHH